MKESRPKASAGLIHFYDVCVFSLFVRKNGEIIYSPSFYALWACYFIGCLAGLMVISIAKTGGTDVSIETVLAPMLVGFFVVFNGAAQPVFGARTNKLIPRNAAMVSFVLIALTYLLMWQVQSVLVYIIAFVVFWGRPGRARDYPRCDCVIVLAYGAGAIAGPQLAVFITTSTGSYRGVFPYVCALAVIGIVIAFMMLKLPKAPNKN